MYLLNNCFGTSHSSEFHSQIKEDSKDSTLLKIAGCIPVLGLLISYSQISSLEKKLKSLPLPKELRPDGIKGEILDANSTLYKKKQALKRATQLVYIRNDYHKALLVNNLLTVALSVCALAMNIIPFSIGALIIGAFSVPSAIMAVVVYYNVMNPSVYEEEASLEVIKENHITQSQNFIVTDKNLINYKNLVNTMIISNDYKYKETEKRSIQDYINTILEDVDFRTNPHTYMTEWTERRGGTEEYRIPEDGAREFITITLMPLIYK